MREWLRRRASGGRVSRRLAGTALIALGTVVLLGVGTRYAQGAAARSAVRRAWAEQEARRSVAELRAAAMGVAADPTPSPGAPVALLVIPRLGLDEVVVEGVDDSQLNAGPGHLPGSAMPGLPGNAVLSAHRDRHFRSLGDLRIGDTIRTEYGQHRVTWRVVERRVLDRRAPALFETATPTLTLTTCWPIRWFGPAPDRLVVTARPIDAPATVTADARTR